MGVRYLLRKPRLIEVRLFDECPSASRASRAHIHDQPVIPYCFARRWPLLGEDRCQDAAVVGCATEQTRDATLLFDATVGCMLIRDSTGDTRYHNVFKRRSDQQQLGRPMTTSGRLRVSLQQVCRRRKSPINMPFARPLCFCRSVLAVLSPERLSAYVPVSTASVLPVIPHDRIEVLSHFLLHRVLGPGPKALLSHLSVP